jgi:hypothetical protein
MWLLRSFRLPAALLTVLACAGCAHPTTPAANDKNLQAFEAYWQPLVPLYGQARFYENCGTRTPAWFSAVSYGLTTRITRQAKRLWSDEYAPQSFFNRTAALDPVARAIHTEVSSADQTPVTTCEAPVATPSLTELDVIAVREGYGRQ